jgi:hypothetical protein
MPSVARSRTAWSSRPSRRSGDDVSAFLTWFDEL